MKVMSREFTTTEKVLIVVLAIVLLGLLYYKFVYQTTEDTIQSQKSEEGTVQLQLDIANKKLANLKSIQKQMDAIDHGSGASMMASYNNSKNETRFLNNVLSGASDYSISFTEVTRHGDQIRRSFTLQFVTRSYKEAERTVEELTNGKYRCLVDDINYTLTENNENYVDLTATFFETMVGGTPDSALPPDEDKKEEAEEAAAEAGEGTE